MGDAEVVNESAWVQLCGPFAVELSGRRIDNLLPGRQGRLLFAYLALSRLQSVSRDTMMEALWGDARPADAGGALSALISKTRAVLGADVLRGRTELSLTLPEPAHVDVEVALSQLHSAESAVALGAWRRAWAPGLSALFVAQPDISARGGGAVGGDVASAAHRRPHTRTRVVRENLSGTSWHRVARGGACRPGTGRCGPAPGVRTSAPDARAGGQRQRGGGARGVRTSADLVT